MRELCSMLMLILPRARLTTLTRPLAPAKLAGIEPIHCALLHHGEPFCLQQKMLLRVLSGLHRSAQKSNQPRNGQSVRLVCVG
mmetsp:Transcript_12733/g.18469  ORF Transcript_12733/g.18469 Transcript_12733/m.18469 type:complete len:83 (-) Transcript_12733:220-468(-)